MKDTGRLRFRVRRGGLAVEAAGGPAAVLAVRTVQVLLAVAVAVYAASTVLRPQPGYSLLFDGVVGNVALGLSAVLCLTRGALVHANRVAFLVLGVGAAAYTAGNVVYYSHVQQLDPVPFPSVADAGFLASHALFIAAVVLLARAKVGPAHLGSWLDGTVGLLGFAAAASGLLMPKALAGLSGNSAAVLLGVAYPLLDLLLLAIIVGVCSLPGRWPRGCWAGIAAGLVLFCVANGIYLLQLAAGSYVAGTPLDVFWILGLALLAFASWQPLGARESDRPSGLATMAVPTSFTAVAVALLVLDHFLRLPAYAVALAAAALVAALARGLFAFWQVEELARCRRLDARTDELTGLPNRRAFSEQLDQVLSATPAEEHVAVLLLDLDRFKEVNDSLGHHVGDQLLQLVATRLSAQLRPGDMVARLGGDEFGFVLPSADEDTAALIARRMCSAFQASFRIDEITLRSQASVGIAMCPRHSSDRTSLLQQADVAMYEAKSRGLGVGMYSYEHDARVRERVRLIEDLRHAVEQDQFVLHYQPKRDLRSGRISGVEALVRWQHPQRGLIYPDAFLPLTEQAGLMPALTTTVLTHAIRQSQQWRLDGIDMTVAVNLSPSSLLDQQLPVQVAALLTRHEVPASALTLEITEEVLIDAEPAKITLSALRSLGLTISLDDYGTGYCSMSYLRELTVHELKLDRSFVTHLSEAPSAAAIVRSTVDLAHALGLRVVAEGVEDADTLSRLADFGCDYAQGYFLCRPKPAGELILWLRGQESPMEPQASTLG